MHIDVERKPETSIHTVSQNNFVTQNRVHGQAVHDPHMTDMEPSEQALLRHIFEQLSKLNVILSK